MSAARVLDMPRESEARADTPAFLRDISYEQRVENLRGWKLQLENRDARLSPVLEARLRALEAARDEARADRASLPFRRRFPALHKWATEIITNQKKRTPLEIAAAFELIAAECEDVGQWEYADTCLSLAAHTMTDGRRA